MKIMSKEYHEKLKKDHFKTKRGKNYHRCFQRMGFTIFNHLLPTLIPPLLSTTPISSFQQIKIPHTL